MTQQVWTFYDQGGMDHVFGMYHGEQSGHFVAYLDQKILIIDFGIVADKTYTFFFEQELLNFHILKKPDGFEYELKVDTKAKTQLNLNRNSERRDELHIVLLICLIILAIGLTLYLRMRN
ncbi:MAG: hypothetical protein IPO78_03180 [Saprospiraceae bacterium]|nr:hypothetical protein [Saprospiraceae bacterium]MBK8450797.1 hypothetical protein [Saprospiraceae bacterium]MBK9720605.1 hypothetical protein [Saprospiraceae bacterium]MBK9727594.1 hypothetical protein [Saprospiraceae bacterium]